MESDIICWCVGDDYCTAVLRGGPCETASSPAHEKES
jgi:hypothetical protein